jgi:hypothetical protein
MSWGPKLHLDLSEQQTLAALGLFYMTEACAAIVCVSTVKASSILNNLGLTIFCFSFALE